MIGKVIVHQIMPAREGQRAVYVEKDETAKTGYVLVSRALMGWALVHLYPAGISQNDTPLDQEIRGLNACHDVSFADDDPTFLGYLEPTEDKDAYDEYAAEVLAAVEAAEKEEENNENHD